MNKIVNLTPHAIHVQLGDGSFQTFESKGNARAFQSFAEAGNFKGIRFVHTKYGAPVDLPDPDGETYYIVSTITVTAARESGRTTDDLLTAVDPIRDVQGRIIGCKALALA